MTTPLCAACMQSESTKLCDLVLGWPAVTALNAHGQPYYVRSFDSVPYRCDAPLCEDCAVVVGRIHFSGRGGGNDTHDLCPHHADVPDSKAFLTEQEADALRARLQLRDLPPAGREMLAQFTTMELTEELKRREQEQP